MNEQQYRDVLLAKAIETQPSEANPLLSDLELRAATEQALYELRGSQRRGASALERLAARRAALVLQTAGRREPRLQALRKPAQTALTWAWALPLLALVLGFASEKIGEPHRLNLIALPLLAIVAWNLCIYTAMLARGLWRLLRRRGRADGAQQDLLAPVTAWWSRSALKLKEPQLRAVYQHFLQDWAPFRQARQTQQTQALLHLGAAALALGIALALWVTGLFAEYRIGWESTWLNAPQMQALANLLSWPAQQLLGMPAWSLAQIEQLQTWPAGNQQEGQQWIIAYSLLLGLVVVVPRLLLALWHGIAALRLARTLHLPLQTPYFQKLARDFSSDTTHIVVHPFSMAMNAQRHQQLQSFVQQQFGAAAHLHFAPNVEYGDAQTPGGHFGNTLEVGTPSLQVLLFNLAATPEEEAHGNVIAQFDTHIDGAHAVWLYGSELVQRLGTGEAAGQRLAERRHLWQRFVESHGMQAQFVGLDEPAAQGA